VSSDDTDGNQLAHVKKRRCLVKGVNKEEEDDESTTKKEEAIEGDLHQDKDEDSRKPPSTFKEEKVEPEDTKPPAGIKEEEGYGYETEENEDGEDVLLRDNHELEDSKKPPAAVKEEVEDEPEVKEHSEGDLQLDRDEREDCKKYPATIKKEEEDEDEVELKEDVVDDLHQDKDEREGCQKAPAVMKKEDEDEVGHDYSPGEIDGKSDWDQLATFEENDVEATYLPDQNTKTKGLLPSARPSDTDTRVKTASSPAMTVAKRMSAKPGHVATPVPIVQASSALVPNPADEKPAAPGRGAVWNENKTISEQPGDTWKEDTSIDTRRYPKRSGSSANIVKKNHSLRSISRSDNCRSAERSRRSANIVKRKYSLRSLSHQHNKESARSKPLRKDKGSSTSLGEVNQSPMASSDEYEFGRGGDSAVDDASHTSDSVDGITDHDEAIFDSYDAQWNIIYERLRGFKESHGHCELFWAVDRLPFS
jgi:hypothetical protein